METTSQRPARGRRARKVSGDEREQAILATAERLLCSRAFREVSTDDLAKGAGISRPTFYFYFASKDAVLLALLDRVIEQAQAACAEALRRVGEDRAGFWRGVLTAFYDT